MDWDSFTDPENLFTAVPPQDPPPGQCRTIIHGLLSGRPVSWEVTVDLGNLWATEEQGTPVNEGCVGEGRQEMRGGESWLEIIHQLTARSVIRDFEKMAEKESDSGHGETMLMISLLVSYCTISSFVDIIGGFLGSAKRHRMKAIQTSKHCNIICMYTAFTTTDRNPNKGLSDNMDVEKTGALPTHTRVNRNLTMLISNLKIFL